MNFQKLTNYCARQIADFKKSAPGIRIFELPQTGLVASKGFVTYVFLCLKFYLRMCYPWPSAAVLPIGIYPGLRSVPAK
jgi:hypothetical protein